MRAILFETVTGRPVEQLEFTSCKTDTGILAADKITIRIPAYTERARELGLRRLLTPMKYGVAVVTDDGRVPAAGVMTAAPVADEDDDGLSGYSVVCYGPQKLMDDWYVRRFPGWPLIGSDRKPTGEFDIRFEGIEYGTMMKRLVQGAMAFPGADLPIVFEPDRAGTRQKGYAAIDGKSVLSALDDISDFVNGVEYDFVPRVTDTDEVSWELVTGTDADREIVRQAATVWRIGGEYPDIRGYSRSPSPDEMVTEATFSGGKEADSSLFARSLNPALVSAGFPRREEWNTSHSSVSVLSTLQSYANAATANGSGFVEELSFEVRADLAVGLRHGDMCQIQALDHWDMPDGIYNRRVLSVAREDDSEWVSVTCIGEVTSG